MNGLPLTLGLAGALALAGTLSARGSRGVAPSRRWYHGRRARSLRFDLAHVGGKDANDQDGPGFYFTTDLEGARGYAYPGGVVLEAELAVDRWVPEPGVGKANPREVERLMRASPCYTQVLEDWDENPRRAHDQALRGMMGPGQSPHGAFQNVWGDFYNRCGEGAAYLRELTKLGYGGVQIPQPDSQFCSKDRVHAVIFDPKAIRNVRVVEDRGEGPIEGSTNRGSRSTDPRLVYIPEPDSDMDLDEDLDEEVLDAGARALAHRVGIGILRGKDLRVVALDAHGKVVGALFDEIGHGQDAQGRHRQEYSFDILVDPAHQRTGLGTRLMKEGLALGRENAQAGIPTVIDAVNPVAQAMFAKAGFVVTQRKGGHATMERAKRGSQNGTANSDPTDIQAFRDLLIARYGLDDTTWLSRPSSGEVVVHKIAVAKANRGQGRAQRAMEHLGRWADAHDAIVVLTPSNDFGASKVRLTAWYRRLGYTSNTGRKKDYRFRETMIRRPNR